MPPQARLGDKALIPADAHGCVACPHTASGPAVAGSPNVNVNGRPAIRVDDPGIHTACCGGNTWNAQTGSKSVFINGKPAHRLGDAVRHCGGTGKCIEGSGNVFVGDLHVGSGRAQPSKTSKKKHWLKLASLDERSQAIPYQIIRICQADGTWIETLTDEDGFYHLDLDDADIPVGFEFPSRIHKSTHEVK